MRCDAPFRRAETALLLVDMQRVFTEPGLDGSPAEHEAHAGFYRELADSVVPNQQRILEAARAAGIEVLHTVIEALTADGRDRSLDHKLSGILVPRNAPEGAIIAPLAPAPDEIVLPKTSSGVFNSTNIDYVLRNLGCRFLIVAGIVTDQCVESAIRDAADRGFMVTQVEDCCAAETPENHAASIESMRGHYCRTRTTDELIAEIEAL